MQYARLQSVIDGHRNIPAGVELGDPPEMYVSGAVSTKCMQVALSHSIVKREHG